MLRSARMLLLPAAALLLLACGYDDGYQGPRYSPGGAPYPPTTGAQALLEVFHASPDAPPFIVLIDGRVAYSNLDYAQGTGQIPVDATQAHSVALQALTPGAPTTVIGPLSESFAANTVYTIVAEGVFASLAPVVFSHPQTAIAAAATRVQMLHAAAAAPGLAVYLTVPGASLASSAPFGTVAFQGSIGPTDVPSGQYELRVTPAGATTPVLFDSGTITLPPGADLLFAAVPNTGPGGATLAVGSVDQNGDNQLLLDVATPAELRAVHDIADGPAVSLFADGNTAAPLAAALAFPGFTAYLAEPAGNYAVTVTPSTNTGDILLEQPLNLAAGTLHTVYALGPLARVSALVTRDHGRRIATQAGLQIVHGSPSAGAVDIYLTATGVGIASATPTYAHLTFGSDTGLQGVAAGTYALTITPAGSKTPALGPLTVTLKDGGIYTAVARDAAGGGTPLGLILLDDFAT